MYVGIFTRDYAKSMTLKEHNSATIMNHREFFENKVHKILWDFTISCDTKDEARRPDIVVIDKTKKEVKIEDVTMPGDVRVN